MILVRKAADRGHADHGWLKTFHTFSFGEYQDPQHMRFQSLRVMNEDFVAPGQGFGTHPHHDMEIVTYILEGALQHQDSMGNSEVLRKGEFQRMSAGTGITHSEFNPSATERVHLYQIWLFPERRGIVPSYEQKRFPEEGRRNQWQLVASRDARLGSLAIHQDVDIFLADLEPKHTLTHFLRPNRQAWIQVLRGQVVVNDVALSASDGAAVSNESELAIRSDHQGEILLFDLA
jgi:redox-sensitive bicupin YhaK (pirin superfamily)